MEASASNSQQNSFYSSTRPAFRKLAWGTLDRYLVKEAFGGVLFVVLLFSLIWLMPETLFKIIQAVFEDTISPKDGLLLFALHIPGVLQQTIPMSALLGGVFLFRRLSLNSELVAMLAVGLSPWRILRAVAVVGAIFALVHFMVQETITPWTSPLLSHMQVTTGFSSDKDDHFTFIEKQDGDALKTFFLIGNTLNEELRDFIVLSYRSAKDGPVSISRIIRAKSGHWQGNAKTWILEDGVDYQLDIDGVYREIKRFNTQEAHISPRAQELLTFHNRNPKDLGLFGMWHYVSLLDEGGQTQSIGDFSVRLAQKFLFPLNSILFIVLGAFLGMERARASKHGSLTFSAIVLFVYSITIPAATNIGSMGILPPLLAASLPMAASALTTWGIVKYRQSS